VNPFQQARAEKIMARRGHFYAVGTTRSNPGWPFRTKALAKLDAVVRNLTSRGKEYRVYRHDR
jgi:hypothetical protein